MILTISHKMSQFKPMGMVKTQDPNRTERIFSGKIGILLCKTSYDLTLADRSAKHNKDLAFLCTHSYPKKLIFCSKWSKIPEYSPVVCVEYFKSTCLICLMAPLAFFLIYPLCSDSPQKRAWCLVWSLLPLCLPL